MLGQRVQCQTQGKRIPQWQISPHTNFSLGPHTETMKPGRWCSGFKSHHAEPQVRCGSKTTIQQTSRPLLG